MEKQGQCCGCTVSPQVHVLEVKPPAPLNGAFGDREGMRVGPIPHDQDLIGRDQHRSGERVPPAGHAEATQGPACPTPRSKTSGLQDKKINFCCSSPDGGTLSRPHKPPKTVLCTGALVTQSGPWATAPPKDTRTWALSPKPDGRGPPGTEPSGTHLGKRCWLLGSPG